MTGAYSGMHPADIVEYLIRMRDWHQIPPQRPIDGPEWIRMFDEYSRNVEQVTDEQAASICTFLVDRFGWIVTRRRHK